MEQSLFAGTHIALERNDLRQIIHYFHILSYCSGVFVIIVNKHTRGEIKRIRLRLNPFRDRELGDFLH